MLKYKPTEQLKYQPLLGMIAVAIQKDLASISSDLIFDFMLFSITIKQPF
jgi:hypothetical protein